jgi:hypothetical protein
MSKCHGLKQPEAIRYDEKQIAPIVPTLRVLDERIERGSIRTYLGSKICRHSEFEPHFSRLRSIVVAYVVVVSVIGEKAETVKLSLDTVNERAIPVDIVPAAVR